MTINHVSDKTFESEVINSKKPILVDFWAEWCGPCKQIAPILEEISKEKVNELNIAKINIDDSTKKILLEKLSDIEKDVGLDLSLNKI